MQQLVPEQQHLTVGVEDDVVGGRTAVDGVAVQEVLAGDVLAAEQLEVAECGEVDADMGVAVGAGVELRIVEEVPRAGEAFGTSRTVH